MQTLQWLVASKSSAQTPLTLHSDVVLKLSRLSQIDAFTNWPLCYNYADFDLTLCYNVLQKVNLFS